MCGIVACVSRQGLSPQCATLLLEGLSRLKNRGYDSVGMATLTLGELHLDKFASGDAYAQLQSKAPDHAQSTLGIAHTRWATHGEKNKVNAHPHLSQCGRFAIVHNGILENDQDLKRLLASNGFAMVSQTDSEVIAHLLSLYSRTKTILESIHELHRVLQGSWAIAILCIETQEVYCTGAPLLVGYHDTHALVVSEKSGFTNISQYFVLNPKDICKIVSTDQGVQVTTLDDYTHCLQTLTVESVETTPAPYAHWTLKEIQEQPASALRAMEGRLYQDRVCLDAFQTKGIYDTLMSIDHLIVLGCGTSYFAGQHGVFFLKELYDFTTVQLFEGAEFSEQDLPRHGKTALLLLSQSGETKDLHRCIEIGRRQDLCMLGILNVKDSRIAREVDAVLYLNAGREVGVASTKSYTSQVICLALLSIWFAQQKDLNRSKRMQYLDDLRKLSQDIHSTLQENDLDPVVALFKDKHHCFLLGKGPSESVAKEGALKIKEMAYVHSEGYATSSLKHGPFSLLDPDFPVILLDPTHDPKTENAYQEIKARHAPIVWIRPTGSKGPKRPTDPYTLRVSKNQTFGPLLSILPLQLLAYRLSVAKGLDPDFPRNLAKVVTVE